MKAGLHVDTKNRIIQFLAPPPSHQDPLRVIPVDRLATLSDPDLVHQALQLLTTENFSGSVRLPDGSAVSMRNCIIEFVGNSKTKEGREIKKQLNERLGEIKALLDVKRFTNKQTDDGSEVSLDDNFSSIGLFDDADEISSSVKRKRLSTLAEVTVGTAQERQDKIPTNRFGTNVALKDRQHLYATESRTYQKNRALLMVPASKPAPDTPAFPVNVLSAPTLGTVPQVPSQKSALPADPGSAVIDGAGHSDNLAADITLAMSAAPFAGSIVNADTGNTGTVAEQDVSDYGTDGIGSKSPSVHDIQDIVIDAGEEDSINTDSNDITTVYDGIHSDLFEVLFQTLPTDAQYRAPGPNPSGCFGPLLLSDQDQPTALSDDGLFLSSHYHHLTFAQRANL